MATISTHNGSQVRRDHNIRNPKVVSKEQHIDPNGVHETWHDIPLRDLYDKLFGSAVAEYNERQRRDDRKIKNYLKDIEDHEKKHPVYEMIVGVYGSGKSDDECRAMLWEFMADWQKRNPNLALAGCYYHADEVGEAPHIHIDYVPVAHGYSRGPKVQNGLVKALGEQGIVGKRAKETAQIMWEHRENQVLEDICIAHGLTVEHPQAGKGVEHLHTETYKAQQDLIRAQGTLEQTQRETEEKSAELKILGQKVKQADAALKGKVAKIATLTDEVERKIVARPPGIFQKRDTVEFHRNMYDSVKDNLAELRSLVDEIHQSSDTLERDRRLARSARSDAQKYKQQYQDLVEKEQDLIAKQAQELANHQVNVMTRDLQRSLAEAKEAKKRADEQEQKYISMVSEESQTIWENARKLNADLIQRMRDYLGTIRFRSGETALEKFDLLEEELEEDEEIFHPSHRPQSRGWDR